MSNDIINTGRSKGIALVAKSIRYGKYEDGVPHYAERRSIPIISIKNKNN